MAEPRLIIVHVPALVVVLLHEEQKKGSPLTEPEVLRIRDNGACIAMPEDVAAVVAEKRGYDDIDPERAWEQWQVARKQLLPPTGK
jgi:hypothetical protein